MDEGDYGDDLTFRSLSVRESVDKIHNAVTSSALVCVALRKESVDKIDTSSMDDLEPSSRSPWESVDKMIMETPWLYLI